MAVTLNAERQTESEPNRQRRTPRDTRLNDWFSIEGHWSDDVLQFVIVRNEVSVAAFGKVLGRKREMKSNREERKAGE